MLIDESSDVLQDLKNVSERHGMSLSDANGWQSSTMPTAA